MEWLIWVFAFIISQIAFLQLFKKISKDTKSIGALTVTIQIIAALSIVILSPLFEWTWPDNWVVWVLFGISLALFAVNDRLDATTRKNLDISVDTMIQQIYRLFFFTSGIIFLSRSFTWLKLLGGVLIVLANMLVVFEKGKFKFNRYILLKLLSTLFLTAALTVQANVSQEFNLPFFVFLSFIVPAIILVAARQATPKTVLAEMKRKDWWLVLLCGISQGLQAFTWLRALQFRNNFVEVASITAVYVILNVFFAFIFLRERSNLAKKLIAAAIIVFSIVLIAVG